MAQSTTAVSFSGDKREIQALRIIAAQRGESVGKIVRDAVYAHYGTEIANALNQVSFFAAPVSDKKHK